jgi:alkylated DNA repair dioxygenase AlkB
MRVPTRSFSLKNYLPHHGKVYYHSAVFEKGKSDILLTVLLQSIPWRQEPIRIFGKEVLQPRLTAWFADPGITYTYSGITMQASNWTDELLEIKQAAETLAGIEFNSALLNLYRNNMDSMGWHRDNERELGHQPVIASFSFGASRKFQLRMYKDKGDLISLDLQHGSCLIMAGETQHFWEHRVPKTAQPAGERINITFRRTGKL